MNTKIIKSATKTVSLLALISLTAACSNQSLPSMPGFGQQKAEEKKITTPEAEEAKQKLAEAKNDLDQPMRKTVLKAPEVVATNTTANNGQSTSAFGVTASEPQIKAAQAATSSTAAKVTAPKATTTASTAKVSTIPKPTVATNTAAKAPVSTTQNTTRRLTLSGSATFNTGSSRLSTSGKQKLDSLASSLSAPNTTVTRLLIEGHTDSTGSAATNQVLSLKRANAVADYLASKGLMRSSMTTRGLGESNPIADNKTKAGRAQNRRVEITATGSRQTTR